MFTVFVTWRDAPKRAERLANGYTTTRRAQAAMFRTQADARLAAEQALIGVDGVLSWRVAPF